MIAVRLIGGLGNQLFQYAAGRALAARHGTGLLLDLSYLQGEQAGVVRRRYELDCFDLPARPVDRIRSYEAPPPGLSLRGTVRLRARAISTRYRVLRQKGYRFQPAFFDATDFTHLVGFWQSEAYFVAAADLLRAELRFANEPTGRDAELLEAIRAAPAVSVHVRRGDYVSDPGASELHGALGRNYYEAALAEVVGRFDVAHAFVFSDEPDWCRKHVRLDVPTTVVDHNRDRGCDDLRLLSACRHHVIANSSFSWWGAWLGEREDTIVVAPRRWVVPADLDVDHLVPRRWLRV